MDDFNQHLCIFIDVASLTPRNISEGVVEVDVAFKRHITRFSVPPRPVLVQSEELHEREHFKQLCWLLHCGRDLSDHLQQSTILQDCEALRENSRCLSYIHWTAVLKIILYITTPLNVAENHKIK